MVVYLESTGSAARFMKIVGDSSLSEFFVYCSSFELPFSSMFSSNTRKERETQLAEHVSRRRPLRLFYRVSARLSLFPKKSIACLKPLREFSEKVKNGRSPAGPGPIVPETLKYRYKTKTLLAVRRVSINNGLYLLRLNKPAFYCFSFELSFSFMFSSNTRKERETQLAEHFFRRHPLRLSYRISARLSLFTKNSNRGFAFHRCGELFLLY